MLLPPRKGSLKIACGLYNKSISTQIVSFKKRLNSIDCAVIKLESHHFEVSDFAAAPFLLFQLNRVQMS